jgi:hypothetical protein
MLWPPFYRELEGDSPSREVRDARLLVKTKTLVNDGDVYALLPCRRHHRFSCHLFALVALGKTLDMGLPDRMMMGILCRSSSRGIIFRASVGWGRQEVKHGIASAVSTTTGLCGQ